MVTQSAPIFSLQAPKDISVSEIEAELNQIWQSYGVAGEDGGLPAATRAKTFTLIVYEPEETQQLLAALGYYSGPIDGIPGPRTASAIREAQKVFGLEKTGKSSPELLIKLREEQSKRRGVVDSSAATTAYAMDTRSPAVADAIASRNPCRIIALCPVTGEDEGVKAQVSAYCPIQKQSATTLICCEYITLTGTVEALERVVGMVPDLLIGGLPKFLWWKATPEPDHPIFKRLVASCNSVIFDSNSFTQVETNLIRLQELIDAGMTIFDVNWSRLAAWQELTAEAFDPPQRRAALGEVDRVTIDYEKGNSAQALMFLGWLASRLNWRPTKVTTETGDYDIKRFYFMAEGDREVEAEIAGVPTASDGDVAGDLIALRLTSTNPAANCSTVLCSETSGCMRMEAHGGAQAGIVNQVTSLADQSAEELLSQQLQRWGRDVLFEESLAVTVQMLKLGNG
ncbi:MULTISPECIES: glucose-6-phosphate dehydrogenase assembly protein OpcA [Chroococcidiopsis]|uniref:OpcA protein n=1 Tax=Chroococcidiopsis thermalis (strain PCC 7203) TaxID=251229 RepID=K9TUT7_CHRTP|nr:MULTISPECIES: glucose-6-phosphate dehydrogenase assembly protein OpcA [Chroococcidiopsis]AFY86300.1 OpcA protein [Chroococcidiopsis thermalis PCC 7203]PSB43719.1 glucose-6-phosphate dehydrogenase assembly protein OpcA [Cyanosarcina cf. burmensis CCALA 770]URD51158.1 glucose-6-phosphate dehydrogenase assembly protein OpcA [Chroococcidiopsis sp. CCNUC1]